MTYFKPLLFVGLIVGLTLGGCRRRPAEAPVAAAPTAPIASSPKPPEPPPPPKCESLSEGCTADAQTQQPIAETGLWVQPPTGWHYATEAAGPVSFHATESAALAWVAARGTQPDDVFAALPALMTRLEVAQVKTDVLRRRLGKPDSRVEARGAKVRLWEVSKATQKPAQPTMKGRPGTLLVIAAEHDGPPVVGLAFVLEGSAPELAAEVMKAVQTLGGKL